MDCRLKAGNDETGGSPNMPGILTTKDFWGGLMLIAIGIAVIVIARAYPFGTSLRMGPGYFPTFLGGILILFGSAAASTEFRLVEVALLTVALTTFSVVLFVWALGLPYPLLADF